MCDPDQTKNYIFVTGVEEEEEEELLQRHETNRQVGQTVTTLIHLNEIQTWSLEVLTLDADSITRNLLLFSTTHIYLFRLVVLIFIIT